MNIISKKKKVLETIIDKSLIVLWNQQKIVTIFCQEEVIKVTWTSILFFFCNGNFQFIFRNIIPYKNNKKKKHNDKEVIILLNPKTRVTFVWNIF